MFVIFYVAHICGSCYISTEQRWFKPLRSTASHQLLRPKNPSQEGQRHERGKALGRSCELGLVCNLRRQFRGFPGMGASVEAEQDQKSKMKKLF